MATLMIIDDEPTLLRSLELHFVEQGFHVKVASSAEEAIDRGLLDADIDLLISDVRMPGMDGLGLLERLVGERPALPVIIITAFFDMETTIAAMHGGAVEFMPKPIDIVRLDAAVDQALRRGADYVRISTGAPDSPLAGRSRAMADVFRSVALVAQSRATVLITGESGTGKEVVACAIHRASPFKDQPFLAINCAAIVETLLESELFGYARGAFTGAYAAHAGKVEAAGEGTLFLDEIAELSLPMQGKLLRLLESREYSLVGSTEIRRSRARFMAATNVDLAEKVAEGTFREDLFYRLNVVTVHMPPLRERKMDIPLLVDNLLRRIKLETGRTIKRISVEAMRALESHDWPGNVRELENVLTRAAVMARGDVIVSVDLQHAPHPAKEDLVNACAQQSGAPASLREVERDHIQRVLQTTDWHKGRTCDILGISRSRLDRKLREYALVRHGGDPVQ